MPSLDSELTRLKDTGLKCAPTAPVKGPVGVALRLPFAVLCTRHIVQKVWRRECGEPDAVTELMTQTDYLVRVHVEAVRRVIVPREQLVEREFI